MHSEDSVVEISLGISELAVDWPSSCDVRDVSSQFLLPG